MDRVYSKKANCDQNTRGSGLEIWELDGLSDLMLDLTATVCGGDYALTLNVLIDTMVKCYMESNYIGEESDIEFIVSAVRDEVLDYADFLDTLEETDAYDGGYRILRRRPFGIMHGAE